MRIFAEAARLEAENRPFVLASILATRGSTPRTIGHMVVREDGSTLGTVGGGAIERLVIEAAVDALAQRRSRVVRRNLVEEGRAAAGMHCGGVMEVQVDVILPRPRLLLVGGGHVNLAIARAASLLDWEIAVADERPDFADEARFPMAERTFSVEGDLIATLEAARIDADTWVVVATHDDDVKAVKYLLSTDARYVGMLGSKRKVAVVIDALRESGVSPVAIGRLYSPVGLDIGAETPAEIAVSILAEMLRHRSERSGQSLHSFAHDLVVVRGGGDLATGVIVRLVRTGFRVVCLESAQPTAIRRTVSMAEAIFAGETSVEGIRAVRAGGLDEAYEILEEGAVPVLVDPQMESIPALRPAVVVDAIIAKRNIGFSSDLAPVTVALGPGFSAGVDADAVVETNRGHDLGRVILEGSAAPNTGTPGTIGGETARRVLRAPCDGEFQPVAAIGDVVATGDVVARVAGVEVTAPFDGIVRGLLASGIGVKKGFKVGDVDPRGAEVDVRRVSDKARAVAGGALEAILHLRSRLR